MSHTLSLSPSPLSPSPPSLSQNICFSHYQLSCTTYNEPVIGITATNPYLFHYFLWEYHICLMLICGNKMPTRCNRGFYCRSYCLLNMFRAQLCPSSGAQEYYTVVAACGISCCGFQVAGLVWSWGLCVRFAGCCFKQHLANRTHSGARNMLSKH